MRRHPHLYEVNARLFTRRVSEKYGRNVTLATVPEEEWQFLTSQGFDLVWLMGVWQGSPGGRRQACLNPPLCREYDHVLPGWTHEDVCGSPYAIYSYSLDTTLGEQSELAQLKSSLNRQGVSLLLDFVPNHLAFDHPWTFSHPDWFVQGREVDIRRHPDWFFSPSRGIYLAHGRDPNFPPWSDTAQVNFYSTDMREALINELLRIAEVADGVRCDMAMLALNDVFGQVWREVVKNPHPETEFWAEAIRQVKQRRPDFLFLAEVYWGFGRKLQQMGFDFTYDKVFYDKLRFSTPGDIRSYLMTDNLYQPRSARFIENHDEPRAVVAFGRGRSLAAAVILATVPGLRLFHDGQLEGRRIHTPIQLACEPKEVVDSEIMQFYSRLLAVTNAPVFHDGEWEVMEASRAWEGNESHHNLLAWFWRYTGQFKIVVVNYSPNPAQGWLNVPLPLEAIERVVLRDELAGTIYIRDPRELKNKGLYIDLGPWQAHLFDVAAG